MRPVFWRRQCNAVQCNALRASFTKLHEATLHYMQQGSYQVKPSRTPSIRAVRWRDPKGIPLYVSPQSKDRN